MFQRASHTEISLFKKWNRHEENYKDNNVTSELTWLGCLLQCHDVRREIAKVVRYVIYEGRHVVKDLPSSVSARTPLTT